MLYAPYLQVEARRKKLTDSEESIIEAKRPVIINGIDNLVTAQDLLDRTIHIELSRITERKLNMN